MKKNRENRNKNQIAEVLKEILEYAWDITISIYMMLILVVLPFYFEEGYAHIGTDKAMFFRGTILRFAWVVLPLLAVTLICKAAEVRQAVKSRKTVETRLNVGAWKAAEPCQAVNPRQAWEKIRAYCRENCSATDYFAAVYGICVVLSYCFSRYKSEALWGTSGWYMGLIPQLTVVMTYFLISRCWKGHKWILFTVFPVSAAVFLLGYLNRFGIYPIEMAYANPSFISTIGNINWYCGYLVSVFFGGAGLLWALAGNKLLMVYVVLGFGTLITQGSASGLLGLAAVLGVSYLLSAPDGKRMQNWWQLVVLLGTAGSITYLLQKTGLATINNYSEGVQLLAGNMWVLIVTLVSVVVWVAVAYSVRRGMYPGKLFGVLGKLAVAASLILLGIYLVITIINTVTEGRFLEMTPLSANNLFQFSIRWGSSRGATFAAGAICFREQDWLHKLLGVGPDCMAAYLYGDGSESLIAMVKEAFGNLRLTNAHNEWLTLLVNTGLLGAVSFAGMMVSAIWRYLGVTIRSNTIAIACGFCLLAYTVNNMVSFQQTMSLATISIVLGVGEHYCRKSRLLSKNSN